MGTADERHSLSTQKIPVHTLFLDSQFRTISWSIGCQEKGLAMHLVQVLGTTTILLLLLQLFQRTTADLPPPESGRIGISCPSTPECNYPYTIKFNNPYSGSLPQVSLEIIGTYNFEDGTKRKVGWGMPPDHFQIAAVDIAYDRFTLVANLTWSTNNPTTFVQWTASQKSNSMNPDFGDLV